MTSPPTAWPGTRLERRLRLLVLGAAAWTASSCGARFPTASPDQRLRALPGTASADALPTRELDVVVWNVEKAQREGWDAEFRALIDHAHVVLVQEAYASARFEAALASRPDLQWSLGISFFNAPDVNTPTGVATGSCAPLLRARVEHSPRTEPFSQTPKAALLTTYPLQGRSDTLLVINVHAINFRRARHLHDQLAPMHDAIESHRGPIVLAGDFNTHHHPRLATLERFAQRHGLTSVFPNDVDGRRRFDDGRTRWRRWPLDHVYVRGLEVTAAEVRPDYVGSDHKPLVLRFAIE